MPAIKSVAPEHLRKYPAETLDATTLRYLYGDAKAFLNDMSRIDAEIAQNVESGISPAFILEDWRVTFKSEVEEATAAVETIRVEFVKRDLELPEDCRIHSL